MRMDLQKIYNSVKWQILLGFKPFYGLFMASVCPYNFSAITELGIWSAGVSHFDTPPSLAQEAGLWLHFLLRSAAGSAATVTDSGQYP